MCPGRAARGLRALTAREGRRERRKEGGTEGGSARRPGREKVPGGAQGGSRFPRGSLVGAGVLGIPWPLRPAARCSRGLLRVGKDRRRAGVSRLSAGVGAGLWAPLSAAPAGASSGEPAPSQEKQNEGTSVKQYNQYFSSQESCGAIKNGSIHG